MRSSPRTCATVRGILLVCGVIVCLAVPSLRLQAQTAPDTQQASNGTESENSQSTASQTQATATTPTRRAPLTTRDALQMYREGRYQDAVNETLAEIQATPRNLDSYIVLGWSLLALGKYQDALDWGKRAQNLSPEDERVIEIIGEAQFRLGENAAAMKSFEAYVRVSPGVNDRLIDDVYYFMGEIYVRRGDWNHADIAFSTALHFQPNDALYWTRLGFVREKMQEYAIALQAYTRAATLNPNYADAVAGRDRVKALLQRQ